MSRALLAILGLAAASLAWGQPVVHRGMCDASAAVMIAPGMFVVANDEDNVLRVYRSDVSDGPVAERDLNPFLALEPKHPECDIEGAARVGDRIYWIGSHGRNKDGKLRPNRHRLFATEVTVEGDQVRIRPVGKPFTELVDALDNDPRLSGYKLRKASERQPEKAGALNIEGLAASPQGALLIGFRNPIPGGRALIVPLENPAEVVDGRKPRLGDPIELDLAGLGIRSIDHCAAGGHYLILAGPHNDGGDFRIYRWTGPGTGAQQVSGADFLGLRPEALVVDAQRPSGVLVLSDDGTVRVDDVPCKKAAPDRRSFRSLWLGF